MRYHYTPIRIAKIQKLTRANTSEDVEQQELPFIVGGNAKRYTLEDGLTDSYKAKHGRHLWSRALGIYPEELKTMSTQICTRIFISALSIIGKSWKQPRCPLIDKLYYIPTMEYYSVMKEMSYQATKRQGGTLNTYYQVNKASLKRLQAL